LTSLSFTNQLAINSASVTSITKVFGEILSLKRQSFSLIHPIAIPCHAHAAFNKTAGFRGYSQDRIAGALPFSLQYSLIPANSRRRRV
jgi:hypothetical protein